MRQAPAAVTPIVIEVPIRTYSEANGSHGHWTTKARRVGQQRDDVAMVLRSAAARRKRVALPVAVTLTRIAPSELDDDNLRPALKAVRDQVAVEIGLPLKKMARKQTRPVADDRDPRVTWAYGQERRGRDYAVRITIEERTGGAT